MKFDKLVQMRYSVRRFAQRPVEPKKIEAILKAAQAAPSAKNLQSWRALVITDKHALERLKACTPCSYNAPLAILVCCEHEGGFVRESDGKHSAEIDASIAATHMMLQACEVGIGSTWVMNFDTHKIRETFRVPDTLDPTALLVCGYPREDSVISPRHTVRKPFDELYSYNIFPTDPIHSGTKEDKHE